MKTVLFICCFLCLTFIGQAQEDAVSQYNKGVEFFNGSNNTKQNYNLAVYWFSKSAEQGYAVAQFELAQCYHSGYGVSQNYKEAFKWYLKAAKQGLMEAECAVGWCYGNGIGVSKEERKAFEWYLKSAEQGYAEAQYVVGWCYANGVGVSKDEHKAFEWSLKSAEQGKAEAQGDVGWCYAEGIGVSKDEHKAFEWYMKSAEQSCAEAQFYVGMCYGNGIGVSKDERKKFEWYLKSAEQGYAAAQSAVGWLYTEGRVVQVNYARAIEWYQKAIAQNSAQAMNGMAYLYIDGKGVDRDIKKAFELVDKAIELDPNNTNFYDSKGEFYAKIGERGKALEIWNQILTINASFAERDTRFCQYIAKMKEENIDDDIPISNKVNKTVFAIVIANEEYTRESRVPYSLNDGEIFTSYCRQALGIPEQNIRFVSNATLNDMKYNINWLKQVLEAYEGDAKAIFYYAGHGIPDETEKTAFLLPVDGYGSDTSTGYSLEELYATLGALPAQSITVFLDACFSGAKREGGMMASTRGVAIKVKASSPMGKMVVFSASQEDETAYPYKEQEHGLFTYYLLKKLKESKGDVTLGELSDYVIKEVKRQSIVQNGKIQTPVLVPSVHIADWRNWKLR